MSPKRTVNCLGAKLKWNGINLQHLKRIIIHTHGLCRESLVQWAAVRIYLVPIKEPPHQNSVLFGPWRKMAANHGHSPLFDSMPPTIRPVVSSCCPHSSGSIILSNWLSRESSMLEMVCGVATVNTGIKGRLVVVAIGFCGFNTSDWTGLLTTAGRCVVRMVVVTGSLVGQQTPGTKSRLKHNDWRNWPRSRSSDGQLLRSSHFPGLPDGVLHLCSPSLASSSSVALIEDY